MMLDRLEAVTVCVGYGDFLAAVAPFNAPILDRWLVVTTPLDTETREVCRRHNLACLVSDDGGRDGAEFAKGRLIERGLQHLSAGAWRLHLDADIALPGQARRLLAAAHLDESCIYGCDRALVRSWDQWRALVASGWLGHGHYDYHHRLAFPAGLSLGSRWIGSDGYAPIGFFQLWHGSADEWSGVRARPYPVQHGNACRTDVQHSLQWDRRRRRLLPELVVAHLESEPAPLGANWRGRTTRRFGPAAPPPAPSHGPS